MNTDEDIEIAKWRIKHINIKFWEIYAWDIPQAIIIIWARPYM